MQKYVRALSTPLMSVQEKLSKQRGLKCIEHWKKGCKEGEVMIVVAWAMVITSTNTPIYYNN
jgi:hypothetical protein